MKFICGGPNCGCEEIIKKPSHSTYACGYYRNFREEGRCKNTPIYEEKIMNIKPRVRMFFDKNQNPEQLRVLFQHPSKDSKNFDEFGGIITVNADESQNSINSILLDCHKLGGFHYGELICQLLCELEKSATYNRRVLLPNQVSIIIDKCKEAIGQDRILQMINDEKRQRHQAWGPLDDYINQANSDINNGQEKLTKLSDFVKKSNNPLAFAMETIRVLLTEYRSNNSVSYATQAISNAVLINSLDFKTLATHVLDVAKSNEKERLWWSIILNAFNQNFNHKVEKFELLTTLYNVLIIVHKSKQDATEKDQVEWAKTRLEIIGFICNIIGGFDVLGQEKEFGTKYEKFMEQIVANEPDLDVRSNALMYLQDYKAGQAEDENNAAAPPGVPQNPIIQAAIQDIAPDDDLFDDLDWNDE